MSDRAKLLLMAARMLEARYRTPQVSLTDSRGYRLHARLAWPGVVIVTYADDGDEIVRSLPGEPTKPSHPAPLRPVP